MNKDEIINGSTLRLVLRRKWWRRWSWASPDEVRIKAWQHGCTAAEPMWVKQSSNWRTVLLEISGPPDGLKIVYEWIEERGMVK